MVIVDALEVDPVVPVALDVLLELRFDDVLDPLTFPRTSTSCPTCSRRSLSCPCNVYVDPLIALLDADGGVLGLPEGGVVPLVPVADEVLALAPVPVFAFVSVKLLAVVDDALAPPSPRARQPTTVIVRLASDELPRVLVCGD